MQSGDIRSRDSYVEYIAIRHFAKPLVWVPKHFGLSGVFPPVQFAVQDRVRPIFFGQEAAARQSLQSMISGLRSFSIQHSATSRALAPAFDQRHPDLLKRHPTICLQELSTLPDPTGNPRFRQRSQAFDPCWPRIGRCRSQRLCPGGGAASRWLRDFPSTQHSCVMQFMVAQSGAIAYFIA